MIHDIINEHLSEEGGNFDIINVPSVDNNNNIVNIELNFFHRNLIHMPKTYYSCITNNPYIKENWIEHPFMNLHMDHDSGNIRQSDYIRNFNTTQQIITDLISIDNWRNHSYRNLNSNFIRNIHNVNINGTGTKLSDNGWEDINHSINLIVNEHENNQLYIDITIDTPYLVNSGLPATQWNMHFFRHLKNKYVNKIYGFLNDTPLIRSIINDIIHEDWTENISCLIANLEIMFVNDVDKSKCQVVNDLLKCLKYHWN